METISQHVCTCKRRYLSNDDPHIESSFPGSDKITNQLIQKQKLVEDIHVNQVIGKDVCVGDSYFF